VASRACGTQSIFWIADHMDCCPLDSRPYGLLSKASQALKKKSNKVKHDLSGHGILSGKLLSSKKALGPVIATRWNLTLIGVSGSLSQRIHNPYVRFT